jgi:hypothetical protein
MRRLSLLTILAGCLASFIVGAATHAAAQEKLTLTSAVFTAAGATDFRVESVYLKRATPAGGAEIRAIFGEVDGTATFIANGRQLVCRYEGSTAADLIATLNTLNLTTASSREARHAAVPGRREARRRDDLGNAAVARDLLGEAAAGQRRL